MDSGEREPMKAGRPLRINWIMARPTLAGGVKANRLIAEAMVRRGHEVNLVYLGGGRPRPNPLRRPRKAAARLWNEWRMRGTPRHHLERSTANLLPVSGDRIEARHAPDADVSIAGFWPTREWINDWPESKGVKAYFIRHYELHDGDPERVRATYRMPGLKIVIATWLKRLMAEEFGDPNAVLVPDGVDHHRFHAPPRSKSPTPTAGMMYGFPEWKGAETAFEALRIAQRAMPSLRVVAFGAGAIQRKHTPPANFTYHQRPDQEQIPRLCREADCWLVPSTTEGFGLPGLEAAACRCPVVSTRCGGPEDYVEDGVSGRLVPVGDPETMARAMIEVLSLDPAGWRRMSEASYRIAARFDWDKSAEILDDALAQAVVRAERRELHAPAPPKERSR